MHHHETIYLKKVCFLFIDQLGEKEAGNNHAASIKKIVGNAYILGSISMQMFG